MVWCWWSLFGCVKLSVWWISSSSCSKMMITSIYSDEDIECETFSSKYGDATLSKKISAPSLRRFVKENICLEAGKANPSFSANFWIPNICRFSVHLKHFWRPTNVCKIILWVIYCPPNPLCTEWLFLNPQIKQCCGTHFTLQRILPGFSKASLGLTFTIGFNPSDPFSTNPILQMLQYLLWIGKKSVVPERWIRDSQMVFLLARWFAILVTGQTCNRAAAKFWKKEATTEYCLFSL